jgi:isopentenyl phosphate kinase
MRQLVLLKLGGSLITDKTQAYTARHKVLADLALQISRALQSDPDLRLLLGHGSGSFGHVAAKKYRTRDGVSPSPLTPLPKGEGKSPPSPRGRGAGRRAEPVEAGEGNYWPGFAEVWYQATTLNRYVIQALHEAGVPAITFSPAASVWSENGRVENWDLSQIRYALEKGLVPVVHGDVIFDRAKGGTILSTEDLFEHLARELRPERILLAGLEAAVWADFPARKHRMEVLTRASFEEIRAGIGASVGADVTGGMQSKVEQMLALVEQIPGLGAVIFSGEGTGNLEKALRGENIGTLVKS